MIIHIIIINITVEESADLGVFCLWSLLLLAGTGALISSEYEEIPIPQDLQNPPSVINSEGSFGYFLFFPLIEKTLRLYFEQISHFLLVVI